MIDALKKNDKVLTSAGIYGTVVSVDEEDDRVVVRVDDDRGVKVAFSKASIVRVLDGSADKSKEKADGVGLSGRRRIRPDRPSRPGRRHGPAVAVQSCPRSSLDDRPRRTSSAGPRNPIGIWGRPPWRVAQASQRTRFARRVARNDHEKSRLQVRAHRGHAPSLGLLRPLAAAREAQAGHRPLGRDDPRLRGR